MDEMKFIFELGQLKRIEHEGWRLAGIDAIPTVAAHSLRASQIGFILAHMEGYSNPYEVCSMVVFHDIGECRVGDIHKVANRYIECDEERAVKEQTASLGEMGKDIFRMWHEVDNRGSKAGIIAKDADYLEQAVGAKEFVEKGFDFAQDWIDNVEKMLRTESAKKLLSDLKKMHSNDWWQGLKKL